EMINQFEQDDIYVEMTFLQSLELHGLDVSIRQAGIDFANSGYDLWHANRYGRRNLRNGIAPPDSGHPKFSEHADDIDYQIEADYAGLIAPGMPNLVIELGEKFGRLMNYGDGLYGGQFVGGMYAEAFFENDMEKVVRAGLKCIPQKSQYAECISDVLKWYKQNPNDWEKTWQLIEDKYQDNPDYRRFSCDKKEFNIDAKINGAYIVMGLLYGEGDLDKTIIISTRCGQDSDCNPSNAGGVLFTTIGFSKLPDRFTSALNPEGEFSHTPYTFPKLIEVSKKLVRQAIARSGGRIEKNDDGQEIFVIPVKEPKVGALEQCWVPGPIANSRFTEEERSKIVTKPTISQDEALDKFAPGWDIDDCEEDDKLGLHDIDEIGLIFVTHPYAEKVPCVLSKRIEIPKDRKTSLELVVGHGPNEDWELIVKVDGKEIKRSIVGEETTTDNAMDLSIDLSAYAGQEVLIELLNQANAWNVEEGEYES
ncbi:MAG: ADP-ribosylglycohydrolase family protein, partial [Planctomycetota bacterium]